MLYLINIAFSCFYLRWVKINRWTELWKMLPVIMLWTLIAGGQWMIGADFPMYYHYFNHPRGIQYTRFEWLFARITDITIKCGYHGQGPFFVFAFINACLVFAAGQAAKVRHWGIYYVMIVAVAVLFNNQMNAVRQATAVGLCSWAFIEFYNRKLLGVILVVIGSLFHFSCLVCLVFYWIEPITRIGGKFPRWLLILSVGCVFIENATEGLNNWLLAHLPDFIADNTHYDEAYVDSQYSHSTSMIYRMAKLFMIPLYWKSLMLVKKGLLTDWEKKLFDFGFVAFFLRNLLIVNTLTGRFSYYFWLASIFPIYYLAVYYWQRKQWINFAIVNAWVLVPYFAKIAVGTVNYGTTFIYFR